MRIPLVSRVPQLPVAACVGFALALVTLLHFLLCGSYNYTHIPREHVANELYKQRNPNLAFSKTRPDCDYSSILESQKTINSWDVPRKYDDFSVSGLTNGSFAPAHCNPLVSVAVIVTYRNRQEQLDIFLPYMHNFLRKQNIHYKIYVVEQQDEKLFNKGLLYNTGAQQAVAEGFPCLVLHDVDLLPLDDANLYACLSQPRHMSASLDKFRFVLTYDFLVGGVLAIRADQYAQVNGFSHRFEGWGGEDDDFYERLQHNGLSVIRLEREMSRYTMLSHVPESASGMRLRVLRENQQRPSPSDGLSALRSRRPPSRSAQRLFALLGVRL